MRISNQAALSVTGLRADALAIAEAGLDAIDTAPAVRRAVRAARGALEVGGERLVPRPPGRLLLAAVGKCATAAAAALREVLGDRLDGGIVLDVEASPPRDLGPLESLRGTHPLPTQRNVEAARRIVELLQGARAPDLVLCVVSGGGSTLLCLPPEGGAPEGERAVLEALTRAGATIQEINTVRKHTSLARGGFLARYAHPARVVTLLFSDVPGGSADFVASGPTVRDTTTVDDAAAVLRRYGLAAAAPALVETPKEARYFERGRTVVLVSNAVALDAMAARAAALGYAARVVTSTLAGEAREAAGRVAAELRVARAGTALLYGGETTVTVTGRGRGGRNLEMALAALPLVGEREIVATLASDGRDNGDAAGAVADAAAREHARRLGLDAAARLADNDAYGFFERTGDWIVTGATGANVADLVVALKR
jgi:glycerate 2-kinase